MGFTYNYFDWGTFLPGNLRYRKFYREKGCVRFLKHQLVCIDEYAHYIQEYPEYQYEPLEFFYECYRGVSALDEKLLDDLIASRKTVGWGIWLVLITPPGWQCYIMQLKASIEKFHPPDHADPEFPNDLIDKALIAANGNRPGDEFFLLANQFQNYLSKLPKLNLPLRKWPSEEDEQQIKQYRNGLKKIYRQQGADAALDMINNNKPIWLMSYKEWREHLR